MSEGGREGGRKRGREEGEKAGGTDKMVVHLLYTNHHYN